jgi:hypothetical protein
MFAAFYFVIVLAIEDDWNFSYDELINLWLLGLAISWVRFYPRRLA